MIKIATNAPANTSDAASRIVSMGGEAPSFGPVRKPK